ncbi:hypothetical protein [Ralstonia phage RP13]|nr:hypothetical protein [Ralstonia phage RP13]
MQTTPQRVSVYNELGDFAGNLGQLQVVVQELVKKYGRDAIVKFDAGHNNIDCDLEFPPLMLTDWFPKDVKPVHTGEYEIQVTEKQMIRGVWRDIPHFTMRAWWDLHNWVYTVGHVNKNLPLKNQSVSWRGVRSPGNDAYYNSSLAQLAPIIDVSTIDINKIDLSPGPIISTSNGPTLTILPT